MIDRVGGGYDSSGRWKGFSGEDPLGLDEGEDQENLRIVAIVVECFAIWRTAAGRLSED